MEAFNGINGMTMPPYLSDPVVSANGDQMLMAMHRQTIPQDILEIQSNLDAETFAGSEDASHYGAQLHPSMPTARSYDGRFPSAFDDGYSDVLSNFDPGVPESSAAMEDSSIDSGHKRLLFSAPSFAYPALDHSFQAARIGLTAQLHGMFFLAEESPRPDGAPIQHELTCYRRNLFQVTGNLTLPRGLGYVITEQGERLPIVAQELCISATETVERNAVKIICVPWKTPITSAPASEDKSEKEPTSIQIDLANSPPDMNPEFTTIPIQWKRLQFRIATANNGRRKELQQHFLVHLRLVATFANGNKVNICEVQSGAIVVRGRSPRNFQSKRDMPISGSGSFNRRREPLTRQSTGDSNPPQHKLDPSSGHNKFEIPQIPFSFDSRELEVSPNLFDWPVPVGQPGALTALPSDFVFPSAGPVNYPQSTPDLSRSAAIPRSQPPRAPINLSLVEDDPARVASAPPVTLAPTLSAANRAAPTSPMPSPSKKARIHHRPEVRAPAFARGGHGHGMAHDDSADLLYEYFPLSLDDWMPPVDAVYRPHVVHHTNLPADPQAIKNRSKRYFSEDNNPDRHTV